jgi:hypothetical protein
VNPSSALLCAVLFTVWLSYRDTRERSSVSAAVWIVVAWAIVLGSRPITSWIAGDIVHATNRDEGNPAEASIYVVLQLASLIVLSRRRVRMPIVVRDNRWLLVFYLFWLASIVWSDYPVITLKRLVKDFGNVLMVLVLLTEVNPAQAIRATFARCAYLCIPLSIVLIKYYPYIGRVYGGYNRNDLMYVGVALHKNTLGALALVSAVFLLWDVLESRRSARTAGQKMTLISRAAVVAMCWYLLKVANSATSLVCAVLATAILLAFRIPALKRVTRQLEPYGLAAGVTVFLLDAAFNLKEQVVLMLGRDMTLTTRTDLWPIVVKFADNPLLGAGFNTFWAGSRLVELHQYELLEGIVQAHNGYLELYLNGGWVGIGLLAMVLFATHKRIKRELASDTPESLVRFIALLVAVVYNFSEASFHKLSLVWLVTLFAIMRYARPAPVRPQPAPALASMPEPLDWTPVRGAHS